MKKERCGEKRINNKGCLMQIIEYNGARDILVEFQDEYEAVVHTSYEKFEKGDVKNPYHPSVCNVGMVGKKYSPSVNGNKTKEYQIWRDMLKRCFDKKEKKKCPTYKDVVCCNEWLLFENFYEWLHSQSNFEKWLNGKYWSIDKDILVKKNKIYSPNTCCLIPQNINKLFEKRDKFRGDLPIGVRKIGDRYEAQCMNQLLDKHKHIGYFDTPEQAFIAYKTYKENIIKQIAKIEFDNGNITKECYEAMLNYEVEITD